MPRELIKNFLRSEGCLIVNPGAAKITKLKLPIVEDKDIARAEVSVDYVLRVNIGDCGCYMYGHGQPCLFTWGRAVEYKCAKAAKGSLDL